MCFGDLLNDDYLEIFIGDGEGDILFFRNWGDSVNVTNNPKIQPDSFSPLPNYPNPFNSLTTIPSTLDSARKVTLHIYNIVGQSVGAQNFVPHDQYFSAGIHHVTWNATGQASGFYIVRLEILSVAGSRQYDAQKLMRVK